MAFAEDLLEQAYHLARREKTKPRQASLRRAISTAYYALFNLLIREAASNWKNDAQRARLARSFEHERMKQASVVVPMDKKTPFLVPQTQRLPIRRIILKVVAAKMKETIAEPIAKIPIAVPRGDIRVACRRKDETKKTTEPKGTMTAEIVPRNTAIRLSYNRKYAPGHPVRGTLDRRWQRNVN